MNKTEQIISDISFDLALKLYYDENKYFVLPDETINNDNGILNLDKK